MAALAGAGVGAALGFLYLTERGRRFRHQLDPMLDDFVTEIKRLQSSVHKAKTAADEGWRSISAMVGGSREVGSTTAH